MALVHDIQQANCNGKVLSALCVDVKGAFDHVSRTQLLLILQSLGFQTPVLNWRDSFLSDRYLGLMVKHNNTFQSTQAFHKDHPFHQSSFSST